MAKKEKKEETTHDVSGGDPLEKLTSTLIADLNKEFGMRVAYNLANSATLAPTVVKRWLDTGSVQINYALRNAPGGGYPEGRIIEISGPPSIGKSHLAYAAAAIVQQQGGLVVYVDTENATPIEKLAQVGINIKRGFVYMDMHATEHVFKAIEDTIEKSTKMIKNVPILVIWDSVAGTSPLAELNGDYDDVTVGLQARVLSKGFRKITGVIGQNNVTLLCLNQLRTKIGVTHGDPDETSGGKALPYHASCRIRLTSGTQVKDDRGRVIGIHVIMTVKKNKVGPPFKKYEFDIIFGKGIVEDEYVFDEVRSYCEKNKVFIDHNKKKLELSIGGSGAWKDLTVVDSASGEVIVEKKFYKADFREVRLDPQYKPFVDAIIEEAYVMKTDDDDAPVGIGDSPDTDEE